MSDDREALTLLIMGRTATSAADAILAAGWRAPEPPCSDAHDSLAFCKHCGEFCP
jgi:hypothetical protein